MATGAGLLMAAGLVGVALADAPGDPDPGFGFDSKVTTGIAQYGNDAAAAVAEHGGKILAAGSSGGSFALVRYNADGTLDTAFGGGDGIVTTSFGDGLEARAHGIAVDYEGTIVVVGSARPPFNLGGEEPGDFAVARYDEDGVLDPGFGGDGLVTTDFGANEDAHDVSIQDDGKIVVVGSTDVGFGVVRYETDGDPDTTFSDDGRQTTSFGEGSFAGARGVAIDADSGAIAVAGTVHTPQDHADFAVARYTSAGALDTGFDGDGRKTTDFSTGSDDVGRDVAFAGAGEFVVVGSSWGDASGPEPDFALARYQANGSLDSGFDGNGLKLADLGGTDIARTVTLQEDLIVVAGHSGDLGEGDDPVDAQIAVARFQADGDQDTTFDDDGEVLTDFSAGKSESAGGVVVHPDGIVVAGVAMPPFTSFEMEPQSLRDFILARYEDDGDLDTTFSGDGKVETLIGAVFADRGWGVAVQDDGRIVVVGSSVDEEGADDLDFALARYEPDGDPDATFSGDGKLTTDVEGQDLLDSAHAVAIQDDGKILVAGTSAGKFAVARYEADGGLDAGFGTGGVVTTDFTEGDDGASAVAIQPDGRIVVAGGSASAGLALARYNADGTPDGTFHGDGRLTDAAIAGFGGASLAIQPDGAILVAGIGEDGTQLAAFVLARYQPDGDPDTTFSENGRLTTDFTLANDGASAVALQPDGRIVAAGTAGRADTPIADCGGEAETDFAVARYEPDGDLDPTFGTGGTLTTDFGSTDDNAFGLGLQDDGAIVAAGRTASDFAIARYQPDGGLDATFSIDGLASTDFGPGSCDVARAVAVTDAGLLLAGAARDAGGSRFALTRFLRAAAEPTPTPSPTATPSPTPTPTPTPDNGGGSPTPTATPSPTPTPSGTGRDTTVRLSTRVSRQQRVLRQNGVIVVASCPSERCTLQATGAVNIPAARKGTAAKRYALRRARRAVATGVPARLRLALSKSVRARVRKALRDRRTRRRITARVTVTAVDAAGNRATRRFTVRLR